MPSENYYINNYCIDSGSLLQSLHDFLVGAGWIVIDTIAAPDTFVFRSPGAVYQDQATIAASSIPPNLILYGFPGASDPDTWVYTSPSTPVAGQPATLAGRVLFHAVDTILPVASAHVQYWFFADAYRFMAAVDQPFKFVYAGFLDSSYPAIDDPYPLLLGTYTQEQMYDTATPSLPEAAYCSDFTWNGGAILSIDSVQNNQRDGSLVAIRPNVATDIALNTELRGAPRGVYRIRSGDTGGEITLGTQSYLAFTASTIGVALGPKV